MTGLGLLTSAISNTRSRSLSLGMNGQYLCGALERNGGAGYRLIAELQASSLFSEPPHHTLLIDAAGHATILTKAPETDPQQWRPTVQ
jgi:hypothetical protein